MCTVYWSMRLIHNPGVMETPPAKISEDPDHYTQDGAWSVVNANTSTLQMPVRKEVPLSNPLGTNSDVG